MQRAGHGDEPAAVLAVDASFLRWLALVAALATGARSGIAVLGGEGALAGPVFGALAAVLATALVADLRGALPLHRAVPWLWAGILLLLFARIGLAATGTDPGFIARMGPSAALMAVATYAVWPVRPARAGAVLVLGVFGASLAAAGVASPDVAAAVSYVLTLVAAVELIIWSRRRHRELAADQAVSASLQQARAQRDELTGLLNRRGARAAVDALRADDALLLIDLDHFKTINDELGHAAGDDVLRRVGQAITAVLRPEDVAARWGGDEFLAVVRGPEDGVPSPSAVAERLRSAVLAAGTGLTASVGVAMVGRGEGWDIAFQRADVALYRAKEAGRDCVEPGA